MQKFVELDKDGVVVYQEYGYDKHIVYKDKAGRRRIKTEKAEPSRKGLIPAPNNVCPGMIKKGDNWVAPPRIDNETYIEKRRKEYGTAIEQIEFITEKGFDAWREKVAKIKAKYPKE